MNRLMQDALAQAQAKLRKAESKSKVIVIRASDKPKSDGKSSIKLDDHVSRKTIIQQARLKAKESAVEIVQEEFIAKVALQYTEFMQKHGTKMSGVRIIFACSKGDASSDYHIKIENYPQSPRTLHRSNIDDIAGKQQDVIIEVPAVIDTPATVIIDVPAVIDTPAV